MVADPTASSPEAAAWPSLPLEEWKDTYATLHMWTQIVGKVRLAQSPRINHSWQVTLYVTARGLTTSPIPYGSSIFQIDFDLIDHHLLIQRNNGASRVIALRARPVSEFYQETLEALKALGLAVHIHGRPNEVPDPTPFERDHRHASYDPQYANRCWRVLVQADRVMK